ncbi:hypothetical protein Tco_1285269 [Tanacetum coccineum]
MFVDHMHQPWRTLATIINKCLSGKTTSNDKLKKSRIDILWGMFYRENVDYPELIWEDFAFQIDHRKEKKSRRKTMTFLRFTKVIINHFLKQHKSLSNLKYQHYHTIKDDGIVSRLKFVRIGEHYQEYGLDITDETVDVSEESEPKPAKKRTASRIVVKKNVIIFTDDNIIPDPDVALELGKSINITEAEEDEVARQVHATHVRIMTEYVPEPTKKKTGGRSTRSVVIQDTPSAPKSKPATSKLKLKESKKPSRRQPGTGGSSKGIGIVPGVPDESIAVFATSSEGTGTKLGVPNEEKVSTEEMVILECGSEQESEYSEEELSEEEEIDCIDSEEDDEKKDDTDDDKSIDLEMTDDEETDDEVLQGNEQVNNDEDEEMTNAEVEESGNGGEEEDTDAAKADVKKTEGTNDDSKKAELPPTSSILSISSCFGDQFLKLSFDTSLIGIIKDTTDAEISSLLDIKIQFEVPHIQSSSVLKPALESSKIQTLTINLEQESEKSASDILKIKKEQAEKQKMPKYTIKYTDKAALKEYDQKSALYQTMHENKFFNRNLANDRLYHALMEALIEEENAMDKGVANIVKDHKRKHDDDDDDDDEDPPAGPNQGKKTKKRRTKESTSSKKPSITKETPKGKAPSKGSKTGKSAIAKEPVEEPINEVVMDYAGKDVVCDDDQPQDTSEPKITKTPNPYWFKQPPRPLTPNPKWNKRQVVLGQPEQPWFNQMVFATKDPLTFNDLMATPIDFSSVKSVSVKKLHGYGYMEEVVVKRVDRQLYKFKEESYQKKLNITAPQQTFTEIEFKELYTPSYKPPEFSDGTLKKVWDELHHRILDFCLGYNKEMSRRKWTAIDKKRSELMVELIDKQMCERRIIKNLERLVSARELEMDFKLMMRTV